MYINMTQVVNVCWLYLSGAVAGIASALVYLRQESHHAFWAERRLVDSAQENG